MTGVPLSADGSEIRFWANMSSHQNYRYILGDAGGAAVSGTFWLRAGADGKLSAFTSVPGNPNGYTTNTYTPIGNLGLGWTEYKLTFNFTNDTYTVSTRTDSAAPWVPMKAAGATGYDIPMRGTADNTGNTALSFRVGGGTVGSVELGLDDVRYSATPITDGPSDMAVTYIDCDELPRTGQRPTTTTTTRARTATTCRWGHLGTPSQFHTPADVTNCTPCHDPSLTVEHNKSGRTTAAGAAIVCDTCHGSAPTRSSRPRSPPGTPRARRATRRSTRPRGAARLRRREHAARRDRVHLRRLPRRQRPDRARQADLVVVRGRLHRLPSDSRATRYAPGTRPAPGRLPRHRHRDEIHGSMDASHAPLPGNASCFGTGCHILGTDLSVHPRQRRDHGRRRGRAARAWSATRTASRRAAGAARPASAANPHPTADALAPRSPAAQTVTISGQSFGPVACADCHALAASDDAPHRRVHDLPPRAQEHR